MRTTQTIAFDSPDRTSGTLVLRLACSSVASLPSRLTISPDLCSSKNAMS